LFYISQQMKSSDSSVLTLNLVWPRDGMGLYHIVVSSTVSVSHILKLLSDCCCFRERGSDIELPLCWYRG
jgi:hypothetical protein